MPSCFTTFGEGRMSTAATSARRTVPPERRAAERLAPAASVRGELLVRLGRVEEARTELDSALRLCGNARERAVLERKLLDLPGGTKRPKAGT